MKFNNKQLSIVFDEQKHILLISSLDTELTKEKIVAIFISYQRSEEIEGGPKPDFVTTLSNEKTDNVVVNGNLSRAIAALRTWKLVDENLALEILMSIKESEAKTNKTASSLTFFGEKIEKIDSSSSSSKESSPLEKELQDITEKLEKEVRQKLIDLSNKYNFSPATEKRCKQQLAESIMGISINKTMKKEIPIP